MLRSSRILAVDLDGTLTRGGEDEVKPWIKKALTSLREMGWKLILATGRDRRYIMRRWDLKNLFDAWVLEAGLAVYIPETGEYRCFADETWRSMIKKLARLPFIEEKENTISFNEKHLKTVRREVEIMGLKVVFKNNRGVIIILPPGVDKGFGLKEALKLLDVQGFVAAIGDSEIDQELLEVADFRAAVADGDPEVKRIADYVAKKKDGEGVMEVIDLLLSLELPLFFRLF